MLSFCQSPKMDIRQLEVFCAVVECGSFSQAAEVLFLTQPTVTAHVKSLERSLGKRLLDRFGRKVVPTPQGELLYRYARQILSLRQEAMVSLSGQVPYGGLKIAASTLPGEYVLPRAIKELLSSWPELKVEVRVTDSQTAIGLVERLEVDIGVVGSRKATERLSFTPVFKDHVLLVVRGDHPFAGRTVSWQQLLKEGIITREPGSGTRKAFEDALRQKGINPSGLRVLAELGSTTAVKEAVKVGMGIGLISSLAVREELGSSLSEVRLAELGSLERTFYIITRKGKTLMPVAERLKEILEGLEPR